MWQCDYLCWPDRKRWRLAPGPVLPHNVSLNLKSDWLMLVAWGLYLQVSVPLVLKCSSTCVPSHLPTWSAAFQARTPPSKGKRDSKSGSLLLDDSLAASERGLRNIRKVTSGHWHTGKARKKGAEGDRRTDTWKQHRQAHFINSHVATDTVYTEYTVYTVYTEYTVLRAGAPSFQGCPTLLPLPRRGYAAAIVSPKLIGFYWKRLKSSTHFLIFQQKIYDSVQILQNNVKPLSPQAWFRNATPWMASWTHWISFLLSVKFTGCITLLLQQNTTRLSFCLPSIT